MNNIIFYTMESETYVRFLFSALLHTVLIEKGYSFKSKQVKKNRFCFGPSGSFYVDVIASVLFAFNFRRKY